MTGPAPTEPIVESVRDSIHLSMRTPSARFGDKAKPASVTSSVNVKKSDAITFFELPPIDVDQVPSNPLQFANRYMTRNKRVGNPLEQTTLKIDVCAANLRKFNFE
jgi:hypothetical protein